MEYGTISFPILGKGKYIIKNILAINVGQNTEDLELLDIYIIKGFYSNIILEAKLLKAKV